MKNIIKIFKRIIMAFCLLYTFNIITSKVGFFIPINIYSISIIIALDFPGIVLLILLKMFL